jgi:hypothetical protein
MAAVFVETGPGDDLAIIIHQLTALEQISHDSLQTLRELGQGSTLGGFKI